MSEKAPTKSKTEVNTHKRSLKKPLFIGASLIIIVTLVLLTWTFTDGFSEFDSFSSMFKAKNETTIQQETLTTKSIEYLDSIAQADSIKASINKTIDVTTIKKDALFYTTQKKEQEITKPIYTKFNIIAGSFQSRNKAEIFSKELNKKGFTTEIIESENNLFRISIASFTSEQLALQELYKLRANSEIKQVWILKSN